tara:strand:- start:91 stop:498 length:408 start_codon:yes stop_codon:yes gene_type:complete
MRRESDERQRESDADDLKNLKRDQEREADEAANESKKAFEELRREAEELQEMFREAYEFFKNQYKPITPYLVGAKVWADIQKYYKDWATIDFRCLKSIKKAYRKASLMYHPDKPSGDSEIFKLVHEAYEALLSTI